MPLASPASPTLAIANVDRCLAVLEALAVAPDGQALGTLSEQLGMPKSAAHRLLQTLSGRGYVHQDPVTQNYALSLKMAVLGFRYLYARHLPDVAQGVLDRLARETREYCRIAGGRMTMNAGAEHLADKVKQAYSRQCVFQAARVNGWQVRETKKNVFQVIK